MDHIPVIVRQETDLRICLTGATGFVERHVEAELVAHGHQVPGLARSEEKAAGLAALPGVQVLMGDMKDPGVIGEGIAASDGVAHRAFDHDFSRYAESCEADRALIGVMGKALAGSDKPLIETAGLALPSCQPGQPATEDGAVTGTYPRACRRSMTGGASGWCPVSLTSGGDLWRREGACLWLGDGAQRLSAANLTDVARAYRLALEERRAEEAFHAVGEEGVTMRTIAEAVAPHLGLPARSLEPDQVARFGWLAHFVTSDLPASLALTRARLDWQPEGPGMLEDLSQMEG